MNSIAEQQPEELLEQEISPTHEEDPNTTPIEVYQVNFETQEDQLDDNYDDSTSASKKNESDELN